MEEISLSITNSVLTKFLKTEADLTCRDAQDIEEFLLTSGPVTVTYTDDNPVPQITKLTPIETQECDGELCTITKSGVIEQHRTKNPW